MKLFSGPLVFLLIEHVIGKRLFDLSSDKVEVDGVDVLEGGQISGLNDLKYFTLKGATPTDPNYHKFTTVKELKAAVKTWVNNRAWAINKYGHISSWDVSEITNMKCLFSGYDLCTTKEKNYGGAGSDSYGGDSDLHMRFKLRSFNDDISKWNVGKVKNMYGMFDSARSFNSDISGWDVSNVNTFKYMFYDADAFHQNLCQWKYKDDHSSQQDYATSNHLKCSW